MEIWIYESPVHAAKPDVHSRLADMKTVCYGRQPPEQSEADIPVLLWVHPGSLCRGALPGHGMGQ